MREDTKKKNKQEITTEVVTKVGTTHKRPHQKLINLQFSTHDKINCKQKESARAEKTNKRQDNKLDYLW